MSNYSLPRLPLALAVFLAVLCPPSSAFRLQAAPLKEASVTRIVKDVRVMEMPSNVQKPAVLQQTVRDQQAVITGIESRAELLFTDKTLTRIGANSVFTFKEGTRDMDLKRGTMLLQVPKGAGGAQIKTAAVTAAITGTTLLVEYQPGAGAEAMTFAADPAAAPADAALPAVPAIAPAPASTGEGAVASDVDGNARILVPGETEFRPLREGEAIPAGSSLMTTGSGTAVVSPAPGVAVRVLPNSILRVNAAEGRGTTPKVRLDLREGGVINMISKAKYEQVDYQVTTPQGVCAARGTVFAVFVSGGRVLVLGAHGASVFNGQPVAAGRAVAFGPGGGSIPAGSPEFQKLLNLTISSLNQAARQGLIPPSFLPQIRQQLEKGGVKLDPDQLDKLSPPATSNNPPAPNVAGAAGGKGRGFAKIVVLEGEVRVFITGKLGESMVVGPGQMLIFPPNTSRLPEAVDIDLDLLVKTSKLVQETGGGGGSGDEGLSFAFIDAAVGEQKEDIQTGVLGDTNLIILDGDNLLVLTDEQLQAIENLQNVVGAPTGPTGPSFNPALTGPLTTITTLSALNSTTTVSTNPHITDGGGTVYDGRIITGIASYDMAATKAAYLFGSESAFDIAINFQPEAPVPAAAFRFQNLTINGPFPIDLSGSSAQKVLYLVSENGITYNGSMNISSLGASGGLALMAANGSVDLNGSILVGPGNLVAYGRGGTAGDVNFNSTGTLDGGSVTLLAEHDVNIDGTVVNGIDFSATAGNYVYVNGSISAQHVNLDAEPGFGAGGVALAGANITANTVDIFAPFLNLGLVNFAPLGPKLDVNIQADNALLTHDQLFGTLVNVHLNTMVDFDANGHSYQGARQINVGGNIVNAVNIGVAKGNLFAAGNVDATGLVEATDDGTQSRGIITVNGSLTADTISADGNVQAGNIDATTSVTAAGTTSSISTPGTLTLGTGATAMANGQIQAGTLSGAGATAIAPTLRINNTGASTIGSIFANTIQADNADLTADDIDIYATAPSNGNIKANTLAVSGAIFYGGLNIGSNGFNVVVETAQPMNLGTSAGEIATVDAGGAGGTTVNGGNGGSIFLRAPSINVNNGAVIQSSGGVYAGSTGRGGNGGLVQLEALGSGGNIVIAQANIEAVGGATADLGGSNNTQQSGNGGTIDLRAPNGLITITDSFLLTETRESYGLAGATATEGGSILMKSDGQITISNSDILATGDDSGIAATSRRGRIDINSLKNFVTPTAGIVVNNSSELKAMSMATAPGDYALLDLKTGDLTYAKGDNAYIQIGDALASTTKLEADILRIQALSANGGIKIYAGSQIKAEQQVLLYGGSLTSGGQIDFLGTGTVDINSPIFLARAGSINVGANTTVQLTSNNVGLYADNRNWTGTTGPGGIQVNGTNAVPNIVTTNQNIGGANVNVNTRNAPGAPGAVGP